MAGKSTGGGHGRAAREDRTLPQKTAAEKLRLKSGMTAAWIGLPVGMEARLGVPAGVTVVDDPADADFVLAFASDQAEAEERLRRLAPALRSETVAWIAYPKGAKAAGRDVSRDTIWTFAQTIDLDLVANVSLDETWSALRVKRAKPRG
jgi:hypothetical protein